MSNRKKGGRKRRVETAITVVLAIALVICTGLAIRASVLTDVRVLDPLAFNTGDVTEQLSSPDSIATAAPAPTEKVFETIVAAMPSMTPDGIDGMPKSEDTNGVEPLATVSPDADLSQTVEITVTAVGDITMGREVNSGQNNFEKKADDKGLEYFFSGVSDILSGDDLTIGNLEGPLTTGNSHRKGRDFIFRGKPEYAKALVSGSIEAVTIANNHARDFFGKGQKDTQKALDKQNVTWFGFGKTAIYDVKGVKIGLIGFTEWDNNEKQLRKTVKSLKEKCDVVIVIMHWGVERRFKPTQKQKSLGHAAINAGADAVFGHHSHVVGGIELYNGKLIAYGLGNFCFAGNTNPSDKDAVIIRQTFIVDLKGKSALPGDIEVIPCSISSSDNVNDFRPEPVSGNRALGVIEKIRKASKGLDATVDFEEIKAKFQKG